MGALNTTLSALEQTGPRRATTEIEWREVLTACDSVLTQHPRHADALAARGAALRALGQPRQALEPLLEALTIRPSHAVARQHLALALRDTGRRDEARALYALLLRDHAAPAALWHDLGILLLSDGSRSAARTCLRRAVAQSPGNVQCRQSLAELLAAEGAHGDAHDHYLSLAQLAPDSSDIQTGLGKTLTALGHLDEAADRFDRALAMESAHVGAHLARARLNLLSGNWPGAWEDLDWRWSQPGHTRPEPPGQAWDGSTDLNGETILLWAEQGLADTVHLLRFVAPVAARGAHIILGVPKALAGLAAAMDGVEQALPSGTALPADTVIDFNASLADLPRLLGLGLDDAPTAPYLAPADRATVTAPATAMIKVGLVWANAPGGGNTIALSWLTPLLGLSGAAFYSLQTGPRSRDTAELLHPALMADIAPATGDFAELAARMAAMDLIIAVDGPAAHLAGAMGLPVWVLTPTTPNWHWMLDGDTAPLYPSARLFRQTAPDRWDHPVAQIMIALRDRIAQEHELRQAEAATLGTRDAAERALLTAHVQDGDLYLDAGCGGGAACRTILDLDRRDLAVLAVDARGECLTALTARSGLITEAVALGTMAAPAVVAAASRRGRTVFSLPQWVNGKARTEALDGLLARHAPLDQRRLVLRLGSADAQDEMMAGLSLSPAAVVFTHHADSDVAAMLEARDYHLYRFPGQVAAGPLIPFDGQAGPVLALAAEEAVAPVYGDSTRPGSPAAMALGRAKAAALSAQGTEALVAGHWNEAGILFSQALHADPANVQANANLGSLLRRVGRGYAAAACWGRAVENGADAAIRANLANMLREMGALDQAAREFEQARADAPNDARILYAQGLLERDRERSRIALNLFEQAERLEPGTIPRHELAATLLKAGNLARGMAEMAFRPQPALPPVAAPPWDGGRLEARTILVRDEGDIRDTLMLARFIPQVARQGGLVVVESSPEATRLLAALPGVEHAIPRGAPLPPVDVVVNLLDVPRLLGTTSRTTPLREVPYLSLPDQSTPTVIPPGKGLRVGIAWNGPDVPADVFLGLAAIPGVTLVSLRADAAINTLGVAPFVEETAGTDTDLADCAAVIAGLDLVVASDTAEVHLAGAMGRPVWVLLSRPCHWRWVDGRDDSVWYPTMRVFRQDEDGSWNRATARMAESALALAAAKASF